MKNALIPIADGVEEIEAVTVADMLARAGWKARLAGLAGATVTASRGVRIIADSTWSEVEAGGFATYDVLVIPGGAQGVAALAVHPGVLRAAKEMCAAGRIVAAICAGPLVLHAAGLLEGRRITSYPSVAPRLAGAEWTDSRVVVDGRIVTSQGPGTAAEFVLAILRLAGEAAAAERVAGEMLLPPRP